MLTSKVSDCRSELGSLQVEFSSFDISKGKTATKCPKCDERFQTKSDVKLHLSSKFHTDNKEKVVKEKLREATYFIEGHLSKK